ncbi:MAG: (Fe-S)-binding protein [Nitrospirae bacterium]|nr:(Fe-S)-binding protein [Nitrospirota bacterium]
MNNLNDLSRCVRCGACKALCPTYMSALDETMGARGRVAMLGALTEGRLAPTINLSDKIFSCMLCEACKDICPTGINISEAVYRGRTALKDVYKRGRFIRTAVKYSLPRMDSIFISILAAY